MWKPGFTRAGVKCPCIVVSARCGSILLSPANWEHLRKSCAPLIQWSMWWIDPLTIYMSRYTVQAHCPGTQSLLVMGGGGFLKGVLFCLAAQVHMSKGLILSLCSLYAVCFARSGTCLASWVLQPVFLCILLFQSMVCLAGWPGHPHVIAVP